MLYAPTRREVTLTGAAAAALALGLLVYVGDRVAGSAWLLPYAGALRGHHGMGIVTPWLPSAMHAFAFALLSAALLPARAALRNLSCVGWVIVDLAFEAGQQASVAPSLSAALEASLPASLAQPLARYFVGGTFDPADLAGTLLGGAAAWLLLRRTDRSRENVDGE